MVTSSAVRPPPTRGQRPATVSSQVRHHVRNITGKRRSLSAITIGDHRGKPRTTEPQPCTTQPQPRTTQPQRCAGPTWTVIVLPSRASLRMVILVLVSGTLTP